MSGWFKWFKRSSIPAEADSVVARVSSQDVAQNCPDDEPAAFTERMSWKLQAMARYPKHHCFRCNKRNDIENVFFCLSCGEVECWECIHQRTKKTDSYDGKLHHVCRCGQFLKLWDEWYAQAKQLFPESLT
jgi:hypothetical protein